MSVEALIAVTILLVVFLFSFIVYNERQTEIGWSEDFMGAKRECYRISSLIGRVSVNGENFIERATFNSNKIHVNGDIRSIEVFWDHSYASCTLSTANVNNITHVRFDVFGNYKIFNNGTDVVFQKI